MAGFLLPIAGALNKLGVAFTGRFLGGLTGGIGKLAGIGNIGKASTLSKAAGTTGRMANSSWNPVSLLKSAYTPDASGLFNLGMDALPLITDIANNDVGAKSFTGFAGTMAGTKFGGRELNKLGEEKLNKGVLDRAQAYQRAKDARSKVVRPMKPMESVEDYTNRYKAGMTAKLQNDPQYSKQGYNMPIGFAADAGLYSLTTGMNKPKPTDSETLQGQSVSPVTRYMQMTGGL